MEVAETEGPSASVEILERENSGQNLMAATPERLVDRLSTGQGGEETSESAVPRLSGSAEQRKSLLP